MSERYAISMLMLLGAAVGEESAYRRVKEADIEAIRELAFGFVKQVEAAAG